MLAVGVTDSCRVCGGWRRARAGSNRAFPCRRGGSRSRCTCWRHRSRLTLNTAVGCTSSSCCSQCSRCSRGSATIGFNLAHLSVDIERKSLGHKTADFGLFLLQSQTSGGTIDYAALFPEKLLGACALLLKRFLAPSQLTFVVIRKANSAAVFAPSGCCSLPHHSKLTVNLSHALVLLQRVVGLVYNLLGHFIIIVLEIVKVVLILLRRHRRY